MCGRAKVVGMMMAIHTVEQTDEYESR
ncbi:MAG: hypothetical protein QOE78_995, partial [Alphaproteobacteria bacterium]|nr:hypothetical protein [Alphaproteobacteria bacterium]